MADTIELLEAIGQNAALRYASADELSQVLEGAQASAGLTVAVASGDCTMLFAELGPKPMNAPQISQAPAREDDEPEEEDENIDEPLNISTLGQC